MRVFSLDSIDRMNLKISQITIKISLRMNLIRKKKKINKKERERERVKNGIYQLNDISKCFVPRIFFVKFLCQILSIKSCLVT